MWRKPRFKPTVIVFSALVYAIAVLGGMISTKAEASGRILAPSGQADTALVKVTVEYKKVNREEVLAAFFEDLKSPLKPNAKKFIEVADKYGLDYRLLPAISCMESTCGKRIIPESYNPFGWGIYGTTHIAFASFDEAIETVGKGLAENYVSKGFDTPREIAPIYTPPNHVNWLNGVNYFYSRMETLEGQI